MVMEESGTQEISGPEMSLSRGEVVEVKKGGPEKDSMEEMGDLRLRVAIDPDLRYSEIHETPVNFRPEMTGEICEKGHCPRLLMRSLFVDEVDFEDEGGVIGISIDAEGAHIPKSGMMLHPGVGLATEIGKGRCAMTEIEIVISKPADGRMTSEESERNVKEMIVLGESNLFVQIPEIRPVDNKRPSHLVQLR